MEKKQSSIDWFITEFQKQIEFVPNSELDIWFKNLFTQAKAMHKEEVLNFELWLDKHEIDALNNNTILLTKEEFYNERFGGNNE